MASNPSQNQGRYALTPLPNPDSKRGYRVEIDEFMGDLAMTNLFLLALQAMQAGSLDEVNGEPDWLKYYALSAIHGKPTEAWNGWPNSPAKPSNGNYGYCHHSLDTFPTWHRPYMMLYETAIHSQMVSIAAKFPESHKTKYQDAAARFRLPYLDPIMPRKAYDPSQPLSNVWGVPKILNQETVYVRKPESPDKLSPIDNPLFSFRFPTAEDWSKNAKSKAARQPLEGGFLKDSNGNVTATFDKNKTVRLPDQSGKTDTKELDLEFQRQGANLATKLWRMLSPDFEAYNDQKAKVKLNEARPWTMFASNAASYPKRLNQLENFFDDTGFRANKADVGKIVKVSRAATDEQYEAFLELVPSVSVESWHDSIHGMIGQGRWQGVISGQMGRPQLAGFDPIFWMHHNNIDRLLSLHQAMYGQKMDPKIAKNNLYPFTKDVNRTLYTSADPLVTNYWSPGFAVPGDKETDPETIKKIVKQYLTDTYYWATNYVLPKERKILTEWPKELSKHEILTGIALPQEAVPSSINVTAVKAEAAKPMLVSREVAFKPLKASMPFDDEPIELASTLKMAGAIDGATPDERPNAQAESWNAHVSVRKFALDGPFSVHVFIGHVKDDQPERYYTKKNEVGFAYVFASNKEAECASCSANRANDIRFEDVVPLSTQLSDYLEDNPKSEGLIVQGEHRTVRSLEPQHVVPFLKEQLQWRVIDAQGNLITGREQEMGLRIFVASSDFKAPDGEHIMGYYGPPTIYEEITSGKAGGLGYVYS